jgi:hypothetical protein
MPRIRDKVIFTILPALSLETIALPGVKSAKKEKKVKNNNCTTNGKLSTDNIIILYVIKTSFFFCLDTRIRVE